MGNGRKGFILTSKDLEQDWRTSQGISVKGPLDMYRYSFLDNHNEGKERSKYIMLGMDKLQPGGGIDEHYHKYDTETPIFDHVYYVISGRIRATIGDTERIVGADSMIYAIQI
jgi:quercetin dioxygenase-like cupin family protein